MVLTQRYRQILDYIQEKKAVTVQQLCELLYASPATIRRDLSTLEKCHLIRRVHGGAVLYESDSNEPAASIRQNKNIYGKRRIGELAATLVKDCSTVFLYCSSTVYYAASSLLHICGLTVITNGLNCALLLSQQTNWDIFFPSGKIEVQSGSTTGSDTIDDISRFYANIAFISCTGLTLDGVTEATVGQSRYKDAMLDRAEIKVLLCDHTKFGNRFFSKTCDIKKLDYIITDQKPPQNYMEQFEQDGCQLIYPDPADDH
ncbi:DeoR/GlpR family DNA-binding transcription regulator [Massilioclostridium coli]|uniref:DeoR/GlpR family DNA-binding transcription regulator n=1 Tax=Massilioclostridium coli TaxID=1870991 RepID=UPI0022DF250A|nr:DeoR/GlpR family DNA-binding transcription regulator [Massilioclostridium coli]